MVTPGIVHFKNRLNATINNVVVKGLVLRIIFETNIE